MSTETTPKTKIFEPITDGKTEEVVGIVIKPQLIKDFGARESLLEKILRGQIMDPTPKIIFISDSKDNPLSIISYDQLHSTSKLTETERKKEISLFIYRKKMLDAKMITINTIRIMAAKQLPWQPKLF